jgi:hypothetical protein
MVDCVEGLISELRSLELIFEMSVTLDADFNLKYPATMGGHVTEGQRPLENVRREMMHWNLLSKYG